jgi:hypothetical protein
VAVSASLLCDWGVAGPQLVPAALRGAIIVRSVGYERGFAQRSGKATVAVVLGKSGGSHSDGKAMAAVFTKLLQKTRIAGRPTQVVEVAHGSGAELAARLKKAGAEVVYLANGLESAAGDIPTKEGDMRRIVVCSHGSQVGGGCVLGVELAGDKPRLVLNLKRANAVGLRFQPDLLRLARVVR